MNSMPDTLLPRSLFISFLLCLSLAPASEGTPLLDPDPRTFTVDVVGQGPPMVLIPGLGSTGAVWDDVVAHYRAHYTCHVLSLAGFGGTPPVDAVPFLDTVRTELAEYIRSEGLVQPVVVGHSLGGFLTLWLAATVPDLVGPLVILDSLPYLAALQVPNATPETMRPQAEQIRSMIAGQTPEQFRKTQAASLPTLITDPADVAEVLAMTGVSHPPTVGQALHELFTTDLRTDLARIRVPALVIGTWISYQPHLTHEQVAQTFEAQYAALKRVRRVMHDTARHFVMYDDLRGLLREMDTFLAGAP